MNGWPTRTSGHGTPGWSRFIHRAHTAAHRLAYVLRTAGLVVRAPEAPSYAVFLDEATPEKLDALRLQTVQPSLVFSPWIRPIPAWSGEWKTLPTLLSRNGCRDIVPGLFPLRPQRPNGLRRSPYGRYVRDLEQHRLYRGRTELARVGTGTTLRAPSKSSHGSRPSARPLRHRISHCAVY